MSTAHKIAITAVVLFVAMSTAPAAAAADVGPNDLSEWDEVFNDADDDHFAGTGSQEAFDKLYIHETGDKIQFAVKMDDGTATFNENENALQVYIDADGETGITSDAGSGDWAEFYDGLGAMNAEYRISKSSGFSAKIQEHDTDVIFNNIGDARYESTNDGTPTYRFGINKATINDPEELDVKFAYAEDPPATSPGNFSWAPSNPVRVSDGGSAATASVEVTANFGRSDFDDGASAEFTLTDDGEEEVTQTVEDLSSSSVTEAFSVNPNNFGGTVNASVVVNGDGNYSFERDVDNTVEITSGGLSGGDSKSGTIDISLLEATVDFGGGDIADGTTVDFTLRDENGKETVRSIAATDLLTETFTVNPDNFAGTNSELTVDVTGDSDFPYNETRSVSVSLPGESSKTFNADEIGHEVTLDPVPGNSTRNIGSDDGFTIGVNAESIDTIGGKDIYYIEHVIDFDSENLKDNIDNISTDSDNPNAIVNVAGVDDGSVTVVAVAEDGLGSGSPIVDNSSGSVDLYNVTFEFADGLQGELENGTSVIEFEPTTSDETRLIGSSEDTELNYKSSSNPVDVNNDEVRITEAEITHLSEYGNMVDFTSRFEISVDTNDGDLGDITLAGNTSSKTINCGGDSSCTETFEYTPTESTAVTGGGNYNENYEFEVIVRDGSNTELRTITQDDVEQDGNDITGDLNAKVYKKGDFNADGSSGTPAVGAGDVRSAIQELGEGDGEPWDENQDDLARLDVTGDGEISITDITTLVEQLP